MQEHFRRHLSYFLALERGIPYQPGTSSKIQTYLTQTIVHRQCIPVTFYAALAAQCLIQALTQSEGGILYRMMLVYLQITFYVNGQIHAAMLAYLFQHMIKETKSGMNITMTVTV